MASDKNPKRPFFLQSSISISTVTTKDGFTVMANKHHTHHIEKGTLNEAIKNGYINSHDALLARTMKARRIAKEIMESKYRSCNTLVDIRQQLNDLSDSVKAQNTLKADAQVNPIDAKAEIDVSKKAIDEKEFASTEENTYNDEEEEEEDVDST